MSPRVSRTVVLAVVSSLLVTVLAVATGSARRPVVSMWQRSLDLAATALPSAAHPRVRDTAVRVRRSRARTVQADGNATGSAGCDGCEAEAETLQVLYLDSPRAAELDNVAAAWSAECVDCRSTALSVQVVVIRDGAGVRANNRALAANVACTRCSTQAAAYQLVVLSPGSDRLDGKQMAKLRDWMGEQRRALRQGTMDGAARSSEPVPPPAADTSRIEDLVVGAVGGTAVVADADLSGGPAG